MTRAFQADDRPFPTDERIQRALIMSSRHLANANEAAERGNHEKAEKLYAKSQYWLDRLNKLSDGYAA